MRKLFKGGTVVSGKGTKRADVLVDGEKIVRVARSITDPLAQTVDVTGKFLLPGFIDAHTHFDLDVANTTTVDDFDSGSLAAIHGGTTTVIDFACPNKGETLAHGLQLWHEKADGRTWCDYSFHMTIDDWNEDIAREIDDMYAAGISSFKMYMTYPAMMIGDEAMYWALKKLKEKGGICGVHCENSGVIDALVTEKKAAKFVCSPPIRKPDDQKALWAALRRGEIQTISTDHCSFTTEQKEMGRADFTKIPGGVPGVETRGEVVYSAGVATRKISLATMCRVLAENPARLYGMFPRKGVLAKGADADIVVYDPQADHVIRAENLLSRAGYTPYEGFVTRGGIEQVWLRGQLMVRGGSVVGECGGKFIPRGKCAL